MGHSHLLKGDADQDTSIKKDSIKSDLGRTSGKKEEDEGISQKSEKTIKMLKQSQVFFSMRSFEVSRSSPAAIIGRFAVFTIEEKKRFGAKFEI